MNTPLEQIREASESIRQLKAQVTEHINRELQNSSPGSPEYTWAQTKQRLLAGETITKEEIQRQIQALIHTPELANDNTPEMEAFEREEQELEKMLEHREDTSSFAWYKESEKAAWERIHHHISMYLTEQFFQQHPQLRRAKEILDLRIRSFTDITAREQLRNITEKEGKDAIHALLRALEEEHHEVAA